VNTEEYIVPEDEITEDLIAILSVSFYVGLSSEVPMEQ
jgi:hypothetical protein